jgi:hypothetical protein
MQICIEFSKNPCRGCVSDQTDCYHHREMDDWALAHPNQSTGEKDEHTARNDLEYGGEQWRFM